MVRTSARRTEVHVPFATEGSEILQIAQRAPLVEVWLAILILLRWMVDATRCCSKGTFCYGAFQADCSLDICSMLASGLSKAPKPVVSHSLSRAQER